MGIVSFGQNEAKDSLQFSLSKFYRALRANSALIAAWFRTESPE